MHQISANQFRYDCTGTTAGQVGLVFGYKSGADYWLWARDMNGTAKIYHVLNGLSTQVASTTYPAPVAGTATSAFFIGGWSFSEYAPAYSFGAGGFPSGKIGFYTNIAGVAFSSFSSWEQAPVHLNGRWINDASFAVNLTTDQSLTVSGNAADEYNAILLENLRLKKFQTTFALTRASGQSQSLLGLIFNAADRGNYNYVSITHTGTVINPIGYVVAPSSAPATATGGSNPSNIPTCAATDTLWCRAQNDGTTFTLKCINSATAPSEATWSGTTACYSNASLANIGGQIGFNCNQGIGYISQFTLKSWNTTTSAFDVTEHWDNFTVDSSGYANETPTYDAAGNLTYDGQQAYTWDAWNRLMTIAHAYRDSSGTLQHGQLFDTMVYDARNRRIQKTVANTGQWDCNYHYYYTNGWQLIETRNGSSQTLKQHVWGLRYIDELIQVAANSNPATGNTCSGWFYAMQDANFNVLGLANSSGALVERYEYTPYGQRKVLFAAGNTWAGGTSTNDPGCYAIAYASLRYTSNAAYFGLCDIGHQGLVHDEESGLIQNRLRMIEPLQGRFACRDPIVYADSSNVYELEHGSPLSVTDPYGLKVGRCTRNDRCCNKWEPGWMVARSIDKNIFDRTSCIIAMLNYISPSLPEATVKGVLGTVIGALSGIYGFTGEILSIGVISIEILFKANDICSDPVCVGTRQADTIVESISYWNSWNCTFECVCLSPDGTMVEPM